MWAWAPYINVRGRKRKERGIAGNIVLIRDGEKIFVQRGD